MENINNKGRTYFVPKFIYSVTDLCDLTIEHSNDLIIAVDRQLKIILFNKVAEKKFNCTKSDALNKSLFDFFPEAHDEIFIEYITGALKGVHHLQKKLLQNHYHRYEWLALPLTDKYKGTLGALCIIKDITHTVENEQKIKELNRALNEKQFLLNNRAKMAETIIDASNDLIIVLDKNFTYRAANKAFLKYCAKKQEDLIGKNLLHCFPQAKNSEILSKIKEAFNGISSTIFKMPCTLKEGFCNVFITPLSYQNTVYGVLIIAHDITQLTAQSEELINVNAKLKKQHAEIEEKNTLVESLFNSTRNTIAICDDKLNFVDVNESYLKYLKLDKDNVVGRNLLDLYPEMKKHRVYEKIQKALEGEPQLFCKYNYIKTKHSGDLSIVPLKNTDGAVNKIVIIGQ